MVPRDSQLRAFFGYQLAGWTIAAVLSFGSEGKLVTESPAVLGLMFVSIAGGGVVFSSLLALLFQRVGLHDRPGWAQLLLVAVTTPGFAVLWWLSVAALEAASGLEMYVDERTRFTPDEWDWIALTELMSAMVGWVAVYMAITGYQRATAAARDAERAMRLAREAELRRLRTQINPHFLFNALNSVNGLVVEDPRAARAFVTDLSSLLRRALSEEATSGTLGHELDFVTRQLRCEKVRFEQRLRFHIDIPQDLHARAFPPMLLQPLVENAIRHGVERRTQPTTVTVRGHADEGGGLQLQVRNTGTLGEPRPGSMGLANVRARLQTLGLPASAFQLRQDDDEVVATLTVP